MPDIDSNQDVMDSRDIESRIDELDAERGALVDDLADNPTGEAKQALIDWDSSEEAEELASLKAFRDELADYCPDWTHGTTLIRDSCWVEYVEEMLADIGDIPRDLPGDGVTYWAR
jgi:hypothetical protein